MPENVQDTVSQVKAIDTHIRRVFTAMLVMGVSGAGKTSLLETFAEYLWETHKKILLLYSWDGGAIPTGLQRRMKQGLVWFWRTRTRSAEGLALETMYQATKGYWPKTINPETGEVPPAVELVAPIVTTYDLFCPQQHPLKTVTAASLIGPTFCSPCQKQYGIAEIRVDHTVTRSKGFDLVGGVAFDGLTSMAQVVLDENDRMRGYGHIGGEKPAFGGAIVSGSLRFGGNNRADIGFAQSRTAQCVTNALSIPFLVESPVFTGLTAETEENNLAVVGLKTAGSATIDLASAWFGNVCEAAIVRDENGKERRTLYLKPFFDSQNRRHLLKSSGSPTGMPDFLQDPPDNADPFSQFNLGTVFRMLDKDLKVAVGDNVKPLVEIPTSFGSPVTITPPAAPGVAAVGIPGPVAVAPRPAVATPMAPGPVRPGPVQAPAAPVAPVVNVPAAVAPVPVASPQPAVATGPRATTSAATPTPTAGQSPPPPVAKPPHRAPGT